MTREEILKMDYIQKLNIETIAELGVFMGEHAEHLINSFPNAEIYLIDIWQGQSNSGNKDGENIIIINNMKEVYNKLYNKYANNDNIHVKRMNSVDFLLSMNHLDMVYIDDLHTYEDTSLRMNICYNIGCKIISGHDYSLTFDGVIKAVDEFYLKHQDGYDIKFSDDKLKSYYLIKK